MWHVHHLCRRVYVVESLILVNAESWNRHDPSTSQLIGRLVAQWPDRLIVQSSDRLRPQSTYSSSCLSSSNASSSASFLDHRISVDEKVDSSGV
jgi:hypothetical protein